MKEIMRLTVALLLGMLLIEHASGLARLEFSVSDDLVCWNELNEEGECRPLSTCDPLMRLLEVQGEDALSFIERSFCLTPTFLPIYCCPKQTDDYYDADVELEKDILPSSTRYGPLQPPVCGHSTGVLPMNVNETVVEPGDWPWLALLRYRSKRKSRKDRYLCSGVLISTRHVLTAAHCVYGRTDLYIVRLGELNLDDDDEGAKPIDVFIKRRHIHPDYTPIHLGNDIAVLELNHDVEFTELLRPICLPTLQEIREIDISKAQPLLVGRGVTYYKGPTSEVIRQFRTSVVPQDLCNEAYENKMINITDESICVTVESKDLCHPTGGDPIMLQLNKTWYSIGVASFGFKCGSTTGFPTIFANTEKYLDFILSVLN